MRSGSVVHRALLSAVLLSLTGASTRALPSQSDCATPYDCAVLQVQRQEFAPAIRALEQIVAASPRNLRALNLLGIALTGIGRRDEGNARFRAALAIDPQFVPALKNLGVNEFAAGRVGQAQQHFASVLKQAPDDEIAHVHLGEILFQRSDYASALAHYEKAGDRVATNPAWSLHKATSLLALGRKSDAIALLDRLPADDSNAAFDAGTALGRFGARAEAARFFGSARKSGYKDAYAAGYNQTLMLIEAGENEAAIQVAQELFGAGVEGVDLFA